MKQVTRCAMIVAALATTSACAVRQTPRASTASASETSLCQVDRALPVQVAPGVDVDDPGNVWDSEATVAAIFEHNARYRAACPS